MRSESAILDHEHRLVPRANQPTIADNAFVQRSLFVFFAGPLTYLLSMALRDKREIYRGVARYIPHNPTIDNFITVLNNSYFPLYLWNGLKLAALSGFGVLIVAMPAAYAFSRFQFRGKGLSMMGLLLFQMISPLVIMVPLYRYMNRLGLLDTHFAVTMVYIALGVPLATWLLKSTIDGIPRSLDEAAMIDGCNRFSVFWRIVLPLSAPGIASVFIITVLAGQPWLQQCRFAGQFAQGDAVDGPQCIGSWRRCRRAGY